MMRQVISNEFDLSWIAILELTTSLWSLLGGMFGVPRSRGVNGGAAGFMAGGMTNMGVELTDVPSTCNSRWCGGWQCWHLCTDLHCFTKWLDAKQFIHKPFDLTVAIFASWGISESWASIQLMLVGFAQNTLTKRWISISSVWCHRSSRNIILPLVWGIMFWSLVTISNSGLSRLSAKIKKVKEVLVMRYTLGYLAMLLPLKHGSLIKLQL